MLLSLGMAAMALPRKLPQLVWLPLCASSAELNIAHTCCLGQSFTWHKLPNSDVYVSPSPFPVAVRANGDATYYAALTQHTSADAAEAMLKDYFQLSYSLAELYQEWALGCTRMRKVTIAVEGIRVVRQDPWECLVSFICSSNNNVKRIGGMLDKLRRRYGHHLCTLRTVEDEWEVLEEESTPNTPIAPIAPSTPTTPITPSTPNNTPVAATLSLFSFPTPKDLAEASESDLRQLGMGYRAKFLIDSAKLVLSEGEDWLLGLRLETREHVQTELLRLPGVGRKVADCVAVFSLDQSSAVPVDTHVWDIAVRDYAPALRTAKSLTPAVYAEVGGIFRTRFGSKAGWAHSVLFAAELPEFRDRLPEELRNEMYAYSEQRRQDSAKKRLLGKATPLVLSDGEEEPSVPAKKKPKSKPRKQL